MARKTKQEPPAEAQLEQVETGGLGIEEGIVLGTFFLLVGALILVYVANQTYALTTA
jgi:hypothetical protein